VAPANIKSYYSSAIRLSGLISSRFRADFCGLMPSNFAAETFARYFGSRGSPS